MHRRRVRTVRWSGPRARPATSTDLDAIGQRARTALDEGAFGVSTGLTQVPLIWADEDELVAIAAAAASRDGLFAIHMRNYAGEFTAALDEAIRVARRAGVRIQISHMSSSGKANWSYPHRGRATLEAAAADGLDIAFDIYPFLAGSANLSQLLPEWVQAGGSAEPVRRLTDPATRRQAADEWTERRFLDWDEVEICLVDPGMEAYLGLTLRDLGERMGLEPAEAGIELISLTENRVCMIAYGRSDQNVIEALQHPCATIGSDGFAMDPDGPTGVGLPHPRSFGCYPRLLGDYVRDRGVIPLERAIAISTSRPADRIGLRDRGRIVEGAYADVVAFDADTIADLATYREPKVFPRGIHHVVVNGRLAVDGGSQVESIRAGRVLRRGAVA
jgi:N-acyl-D-aspartate/D-glutamate deacylase